MAKRMPPRSHSNFATRSAQDEGSQLARRWSIRQPSPSPQDEGGAPLLDSAAPSGAGQDEIERQNNFLSSLSTARAAHKVSSEAGSRRRRARPSSIFDNDTKNRTGPKAPSKPEAGSTKLGTFAGVFVPTSLNVLSILMFLRFGFILGQAGVIGMMGMLIACYAINLVTTMSISAIATNGTVRGGGAYYLISRSLGPEFGGSIGIVFYLGFVFNTSMNAVGLIDCFIENFGTKEGYLSQWLPEGFWWQYLWATVVLVACTAICLAGSGLFARCSNGLLAVLLVATFSIPFSAFLQQPFENRQTGIHYTGLSLDTFKSNLMPMFTKGAAGSQLKGRETWQDLFGILFPATGGIFAGASMSGDLKNPSKAIPKGTLYGLGLTFITYMIVILSMAASITRGSFYRNTNVIQLVNISDVVVLLGEFATSAFSTLMGVIGSAKLLQALARDNLIPGLSIFGQGTKGYDEPTFAIFITYVLAQLVMMSNINSIASFVTMTYLMTFLITNLACFLLKISSAPNFRPSFHYFNWWTAAIGAVVSGVTMFFVDPVYAAACSAVLAFVFLVIHYTTPPKPWGDVSQNLIYHQVRKYLLRLRQEHVKFWRPQILLFINDPRRQYGLIQFCNSLKKGALFVLGHVIVTQDFAGAVPEAKRQQTAWTKYIDFSKIKAFVNIAISPAIEWGTRNVVLSAGLGGMRPNIVIMGFYNLNELRTSQPLVDVPSPQPLRPVNGHVDSEGISNKRKGKHKPSLAETLRGRLPTDTMRKESAVNPTNYVTILEDLLLRLQMNVAIAKGFQDLEFPAPKLSTRDRLRSALGLGHVEEEGNSKRYIDLWPIQMSAEIAAAGEDGQDGKNVLTTNFDTYTLILQLGCILNTVPSWKRAYKLRVAVFVEYESDVEEERNRVLTLLENLRIQADVLVFWLASGDLKTYEMIVNDKSDETDENAMRDVEEALEGEEWWEDLQKLRNRRGNIQNATQELAEIEGFLGTASNWPSTAFQHGPREAKAKRFAGLRKMLRRTRRKTSMSSLGKLNLGMRTHRLPEDLTSVYSSSSEDFHYSDSEAVEDTDEDEASAASEADVDLLKLDDSDEERIVNRPKRSLSMGDKNPQSSAVATKPPARLAVSAEARNIKSSEGAAAESEDADMASLPSHRPELSSDHAPSYKGTSRPPEHITLPERPPVMRKQSLPRFTSAPVPRTEINTDDGPGPSIMFTDAPSPSIMFTDAPSPSIMFTDVPSPSTNRPTRSSPRTSIYHRRTSPSSNSQAASGFPQPASLPLSFNDLPCRAQHLILNELVKRESRDTAVIFTTLPSPVAGTGEKEEESVRYLSDLEVLCQGLPPVMLVHSNSMTVTMNL